MMAPHTTTLRYTPPAWATGHITASDAAFLATLVTELAPSEMVEVGVASGCSSAVLLQALAGVQRTTEPALPWLFSFDIATHCYFDPSRLVGAAVDDMAPDLRSHWRLFAGDALAAREMLRQRELPLGFIDADHRHPWPTLDFLAILPTLRAGAWVALHDIRLPELGSGPMFDNHGAQYLFEAWPWTKRSDGNIGAVRLEASTQEIHAFCARLLDVKWEATVSRATLEALGQQRGAEAFDDERSPIDRAIARVRQAASPDRPLMVWGAGQAGREFLTRLRAAGIPVATVLDRDPAKHGSRCEGVVVGDPASLRTSNGHRPFVAVCSIYAEEIGHELDRLGLIAGFDYTLV
jgi:hypothetical protein